MTRHVEIVEEFIAAWQRRDIEQIVTFLHPDIRYHNMPLDPIDGLPATRKALEGLLAHVDDLRWDIRNVAETPDGTVLYEKTEHYLIDGAWVALPCMIALEFTDDLISHWRAYFDLTTWTKQQRTPASLSALERIEIFELTARYADALDLLEPDGLRQVFTDDAVWEIVDGMRLDGVEQIMGFMGRPDVHPGAHLMTNVYVASVDAGADGRVVHLRSRGLFPVGPSDPRNPTQVFYGRYDDEVVHTDGGWRIRHRRYRFGS